jgi:protocatechuate 3,4-dioxygenase beta subunit
MKRCHRTKRDERAIDIGDLLPRLDHADPWHVNQRSSELGRPSLPRSTERVTRLKHQSASRAQRCSDAPQGCRPVLVSEEDLRHVGGHERGVDAQPRQRCGIAQQPCEGVGIRLGAGDIERSPGRIDPRHVNASPGEHAGKGSRAAADVEHRSCAQLVDHVDVDIKIRTIWIERVVDQSKSRVIKDGVRHPPILTLTSRRPDLVAQRIHRKLSPNVQSPLVVSCKAGPMTEHEHDVEQHDLGLHHDLQTLVRTRRAGISRRYALKVFGGASALVLAACGSKSATSKATTAPQSTATSATTGTPIGGPGGGPPPGGSGGPGGPPPGGPPPGGPGGGGGSQPADGTIPQETAGPFPGDGSNGPNALSQSGIIRSDITSTLGSSTKVKGVPLTVKLKITKGANGPVMPDAAVYVWHCDQAGRYSMYSQGVTQENWLRGVQQADANGEVTFTTIYPGCYPGRWPHIHYEVYASLAEATAGKPIASTSQLALTADSGKAVYATKGYEASVPAFANISLASDNVFSDGAEKETPTFTGDAAKGFVATLTVPVAV